MYLPLHHEVGKTYYFKIRVTKLCYFTISLPLLAFLSCLWLTLYKDFENANNTHCKVPNILPSISASIGNYEPQITIWKTCIYVHAPFRFIIIYLRWRYYTEIISKDLKFIINFAVFLNIVENVSLLGLTYWTSSQYYPYHEVCFETFIGTSLIYMFFTCLMLSKYRRNNNQTKLEKYSLNVKWKAFFLNVLSFTSAAFFFFRHNTQCEPYVYSMFGFSEYLGVISNISFHLTTIYDIQVQYVYFSIYGLYFK